MTKEMREVYESIVEKSELAGKLEKELKALKAKVIEYHKGQKLLVEDGFESSIKHTVRDTPQVKAIAEAFSLDDLNYEAHPECFKRTEYDSVTVKKLIVEG